MSDNDLANLAAVSTNDKDAEATENLYWCKTTNTYDSYSYLPTLTNAQVVDNFYGITLTANGKELDFTKGLRFGKVCYGSLPKGRFIIDDGKRLKVVSADNGFIIPELKRNDIVKVSFVTASNGSERTLKLTNAVLVEGSLTNSNSNVPNEVTLRVISDGYVGFRGTEGLNYYSITVNEDKEQPTAYQLATLDTDYYSLYLDYDAIIPNGITAYTAALNDDQTAVELTEVTGTVLKRNRGYIVKGNAMGTFTFDVSDIMGDEIEGNKLKGVTVDTEASEIEKANPGKTVIMLGLKDGVMGFRKPAKGEIEANKAYLLADTPLDKNKIIAIRNDGTTTGIGRVTTGSSDKNAPMFNLAGQRVGSNFKGIVLVNGKKVIRK